MIIAFLSNAHQLLSNSSGSLAMFAAIRRASLLGCFLGPASGGQTITNTHFTDWILRGGLSYQFH